MLALNSPIDSSETREESWTDYDDYPHFRLKVPLADGDLIVADSESQEHGMVPWQIRRGSTGEHFTAYNTYLGPAIAAILPPGALNRERLVSLREHPQADENEFKSVGASDSTAPDRPRANDLDERLFHLGWEKDPLASLEYLLSSGVNVDAQDHLGQTALAIAVRYKKDALV